MERLGNPAGSHRSSGTAQHSLVDATPGSSRWNGNGGCCSWEEPVERCKPTNKRREIRYKGEGGLVKKNLDIYLCGCVMMWLKGGGCRFLNIFFL